MTVQAKIPICSACLRFRAFDQDHPQAWCEAFPGGIPDAIFTAAFDHRTAFPDGSDNGILFELDPAKTAQLAAYEDQPV